jgi:hypothetical protein
VLGLSDVNPPGKNVDGGAPDATPACAPRLDTLRDDFGASSPCMPWGSSYDNAGATISESNHALTIVGNASFPSFAGCDSMSSTALQPEGIFVAVDKHFQDQFGYTVLGLNLAPGAVQMDVYGSNTVQLENRDGSVIYGTPATYDPTAMRFLRIRPDAAMTSFVGEVSPDAAHWTAIADTGNMVPVPTTVTLTLVAGNDSTGDGSTAQFSHLNECP